MKEFIHNENLALFKKKLADPQITGTERKVVQKLLAEEEARELPAKHAEQERRSPAGRDTDVTSRRRCQIDRPDAETLKHQLV